MEKIAKKLTDLVGNTPLLELSNYNKNNDSKARLIVKIESFNPAGSVKDRIALAMIEDAETKGVLQPGATIIEPTSGNTGVGLAFVSAAKGYKLVLTMTDTMSIERRNLLKALGAELVLTPGADGMKGAIAKAEELKPQVLFLAYGMNDIKAARGNAKAFAKAYKAVLERLKESLPDTRIYVNSILPVRQSVIDENEWYGNIGEYNKKLEALCEKEDVTFIDNGSLVKEEYYTEDGIHMQPDYYTEWVNHMAEVADL